MLDIERYSYVMAPSSAYRYDFAPITKSETTDEGYLRVWCRAARTGTQLYRRSDGSQVREYRPPEEVSNPESLQTFGMKPATWGHPPVLLDSKNTKQHQIGYSGSQVRYNDGFVEVALVVTDQDSIDKIKRGDARQVSAGYKVDFDPTPGQTPEGEDYNGVQRNIRVNHIAVVPVGRAGPEVKLLMDRMDSADAVAYDPEPGTPAQTSTSTASPSMASVKFDGLEIDLPVEAAGAVQSVFKDLNKQIAELDASKAELESKLDAAEKEVESIAYEKEAAEGRADALTERVAELEAETSSRTDAADIDELIKARLAVFQHLAPAFAEDYKFDGIDEEELYVAAFTNLTGEEPREDAAPEYVAGVVDGLLHQFALDSEEEGEEEEPVAAVSEAPAEEKEDRADSTVALRQAVSGAGQPQPSAHASYAQKMADAWKSPLHATR